MAKKTRHEVFLETQQALAMHVAMLPIKREALRQHQLSMAEMRSLDDGGAARSDYEYSLRAIKQLAAAL